MIIVLGWVILAGVARYLQGTWWEPGALLAFIFAVDAAGTASLAPEYHNSFTANLLLQGLVLALVVGGLLARGISDSHPRNISFEVTRVRALLAFGYCAATVSLLATLNVVGAGPTALMHWSQLSAIAQESTKLRYTVGFDFPLYYNISNACTLAYAMVVSAHWVQARRITISSLGPLLIYCVSNLLITTRAPILFLLILMIFSSVWAARASGPSGQFPPLLSRRNTWKVLLIGSLVAGVFFWFQVVRFGQQYAQPAGVIWAHLRRYPWGSLPSFSMWREGLAGSTPSHHAGYYTFMGIFDNLGIEPRTEGGFVDYVTLAPGELGNVYTAFRGTILDFGALGAALFLAAVGLVAGFAIRTSYFPPRVSLCIYVGVASFVAWAPFFSFWAYTANIAALLIFPGLHLFFTRSAHRVTVPSEGIGVVGANAE